MSLIDLTRIISESEGETKTFTLQKRVLKGWPTPTHGLLYDFHVNSMSGTYIDFPGHIEEFHDGSDAANYPLDKLYRLDTEVLHLNRDAIPGPIHAEELEKAWGHRRISSKALCVHVLGETPYEKIPYRSIYYDKDALNWILDRKISLFISDVYERVTVDGAVFHTLFSHGISTVCMPINLQLLTAPQVKTTTLMVRHQGVTQIPCRVIAEF